MSLYEIIWSIRCYQQWYIALDQRCEATLFYPGLSMLSWTQVAGVRRSSVFHPFWDIETLETFTGKRVYWRCRAAVSAGSYTTPLQLSVA
jgi:hypothetical protein